MTMNMKHLIFPQKTEKLRIKITGPPNPLFFIQGVEAHLSPHKAPMRTQHINKSTEEGVFIYKV